MKDLLSVDDNLNFKLLYYFEMQLNEYLIIIQTFLQYKYYNPYVLKG